MSTDWFKGKTTGKPHISWENQWFPVKIFPSTNPLTMDERVVFTQSTKIPRWLLLDQISECTRPEASLFFWVTLAVLNAYPIVWCSGISGMSIHIYNKYIHYLHYFRFTCIFTITCTFTFTLHYIYIYM